MRNGGRGAGAVGGPLSPGNFPLNRPGTGGMMPGMPGARKMPGMPGLDDDNWEVPRSKSSVKGEFVRNPVPLAGRGSPINSKLLPQGSGGLITGKTSALLQGSGGGNPIAARPTLVSGPGDTPAQSFGPSKPLAQVTPVTTAATEKPAVRKSNLADLQRKTKSLLEEYFHVRILDEAVQCIEELKSPDYHPEVVKEAINLALDKGAACVELVVKLLSFLLAKKIFTPRDLGTGCLLYGSMLDDIAIDLPKAPTYFGEVVGKLIVAGGLSFKVAEEILKNVEDSMFRDAILSAIMRSVEASPSAPAILGEQAAEVKACQSLLS